LGFVAVTSVRAGKYMEVKLEGNDQGIAHQQVDEMCKKLLANPVIENYTFELEEI
jgi:phosphoribosylformylglycinamidine synthase